ncbi:MAG TPA: twin-arginine translocase TatA/TatE family subunit [Terracidiphilus sp.]|jgi:sec-independent protein translocase protein TatB|nr:twin-arginine translocase TatA/TatE family subunit [Terracidiphilus sp.]
MGIVPQIELDSLGMADSLILMVLALVVFGPRRLPQIGRQIGKLMYEFRKASNDFKFQMEEELRVSEEADRNKKQEAERRQIPQESVSAASQTENTIAPPSVIIGSSSVAGTHAEGAPRIQPPSTGEIIAAERPTSAVSGAVLDPMGQLEQPSPEPSSPKQSSTDQSNPAQPSDEPPPSPNDSAPVTEAVSHNG